MQDYLIVKGQIDSIETENPPEAYKPNEWQKLDRIFCATIQMHLSESVYFIVQSFSTSFELWKTLSDTYEKKVAATKIYLIRRLYNLRMKESDSVHAHLNEYESLSSQISSQGNDNRGWTKSNVAHEQSPLFMGNFRHNRVQCFDNRRQVLRSHERNPDWSNLEKVFHKRLGRGSLCSTRFNRPIEQPWKKFFPTAEQLAKPEQVSGQPNLQLLQETGTHQRRFPGTEVKDRQSSESGSEE